MKPWENVRGATEAVRILRWMASIGETHARTAYDAETLQEVTRARRAIEDLLGGAAPETLASQRTSDGLALLLTIAANAALPWGEVGVDGVDLAGDVLVRMGLIDLVPAVEPRELGGMPSDVPGQERDAISSAEDLREAASPAEETGREPI